VCLCVCVSNMCIYIYMCVLLLYTHTHAHTHTHIYIYIYIYIYVYIRTYICQVYLTRSYNSRTGKSIAPTPNTGRHWTLYPIPLLPSACFYESVFVLFYVVNYFIALQVLISEYFSTPKFSKQSTYRTQT